MSSLLNSKIYLIPLVIVGLGVMTVASAQTSGSPFSSKKKKQAWEVDTAPAPRSNGYSGALDRLPAQNVPVNTCLLYTSPSPRDLSTSRMPSSA